MLEFMAYCEVQSGSSLCSNATHCSVNACICAVGVMASIPTNLMRSGAGEIDNEAVARAAIGYGAALCARQHHGRLASWLNSLTFSGGNCGWLHLEPNTIGVYALLLGALGRSNSGVHKACALFSFVVGTAGAAQVPVVA